MRQKENSEKNQRMTVSIVTNMFNEDMYYLNIKSTCGTGECININYCPVCRKKIRRTSMNKKIEEAIERLNNFKNITILYSNIVAMNVQELKQVQQDIETLVQALENSIPKEVVEEKIDRLGISDEDINIK